MKSAFEEILSKEITKQLTKNEGLFYSHCTGVANVGKN